MARSKVFSVQKTLERMSIYFRIARLPRAQSLPLILANLARSAGSSAISTKEILYLSEGAAMSHFGTEHPSALK
jgi:hypothetical protein